MTDFQKMVLDILICGLNGEKGQIGGELNLDKLFACAARHQVSVLAYYGLKNSGLFSEEKMAGLKDHAYNIIYATLNQIYELERLQKAFDDAGIEHCALKGAYIRGFYPQPEMRSMSDMDILIKESQYSKIKPLMKSLGYEFCYESDHEIAWKLKNGLIVELHKCVVPTYNKDFIDYYGDGWAVFGEPQNMLEKHYIYSFVHFAKHYRDGGAGIKYVLDFYVLQRANPQLDFEYIRAQLERLKLLKFYDNILKTLSVWFENAPETDTTRLITKNLFASGVYGNFEKHAIARAYKKSIKTGSVKTARLSNLLSSAFSSLDDNKKRHRFLHKCPFLLPVAWMINWVSAISANRNKIGDVFKKASVSTEANVEQFRRDLQAVGLDFYD